WGDAPGFVERKPPALKARVTFRHMNCAFSAWFAGGNPIPGAMPRLLWVVSRRQPFGAKHDAFHGCLYRKWGKEEVNVLTREAAARHGKSSLLLQRTHDRNYFYSTVRQGHNQRNPPPCQR